MAEVKALFPIGKTQWAKWNDDQRKAFNMLRQQGKSFDASVTYINSPGFADIIGAEPEMKPKKKKSLFDVIEDVAEIAGDIAEVGAMVTPVANVIRASTKKKGK